MSTKSERLTITFTKPQTDFLRDEAARLGISFADLVRRIIDEYRRAQERRK